MELKDGWGQSALFWAVRNRKLKHVDLLLAAGADHNALDARGKSVLRLAIWRGHTKIANQLIAHGADINAITDIESKQTLLHYCVNYNKEKCVVYLLKNGASVAIKDGYGYTVVQRVAMKDPISDNIRTLIRDAAKTQTAPNVDEE